MITLLKMGLNLRKLIALRLVFVLLLTNASVFAQVDYLVGDTQIKVTPPEKTVHTQKLGEALEEEPEESQDVNTTDFINTASSENVTVMINEASDASSEEVSGQVLEQISGENSEQVSEQSRGEAFGAQNLTQNFKEYEETKKSFGINYRYLGVLSQLGVEKSIAGRFSMGLYYGRYVGKVAGTDDLGFIPDLHHMALQTNIYLGREGISMTSGPVIRFAIHANQQKENELVKSVQVDGVDVIVPGETRYGTLLGIGYTWQKNWFNVSVGAEYLTLGPLKNLVPLAVSLGVAF